MHCRRRVKKREQDDRNEREKIYMRELTFEWSSISLCVRVWFRIYANEHKTVKSHFYLTMFFDFIRIQRKTLVSQSQCKYTRNEQKKRSKRRANSHRNSLPLLCSRSKMTWFTWSVVIDYLHRFFSPFDSSSCSAFRFSSPINGRYSSAKSSLTYSQTFSSLICLTKLFGKCAAEKAWKSKSFSCWLFFIRLRCHLRHFLESRQSLVHSSWRDEQNCYHCRANSEINAQAHQRLVLKYCVFIFGVRFVIRSRSSSCFFCITLARDSVTIKCVSLQSNRCLVFVVVVGWQPVSQWCVIRSVWIGRQIESILSTRISTHHTSLTKTTTGIHDLFFLWPLTHSLWAASSHANVRVHIQYIFMKYDT